MTNSWINTKGQVIECPEGHNNYASEFLEKEMGLSKMMDFLNEKDFYPYQELHARGWVRLCVMHEGDGGVRILGDCVDLTKPMRNTMDPAMNSAQMRTAKRICKQRNLEYHKVINERRFW